MSFRTLARAARTAVGLTSVVWSFGCGGSATTQSPVDDGSTLGSSADAGGSGPSSADGGTGEGAGQHDAGSASSADAGASLPTDPLPVDSLPSGSDALAGVYAGRTRASSVSMAFGTNHSTQTNYELVTIEKQGQQLVMRERACHVEFLTDSPDITATVADVVALTTPEIVGPLGVRMNGATLEWERPTAGVTGGYVGWDGKGEIPSNADDPHVTDPDKDGHPGVSVHAKVVIGLSIEADTYSVQTIRGHYIGTREGKRLVAENFDESKMITIGASNPLLAAGGSASRDDKGDNTVVMVPMASSTTCDEIVAQKDHLFD